MRASTRLVLLAAGACAVFGLFLKIADRAGAPAGAREASVASRSDGHPHDVDLAAREPSAVEPEHPRPDGEARDDGPSEPSASHHTASTPYELLDANGSHVLSPRARARQARREAREARMRDGSLSVAGVGSTGAPALGASGGHQNGAAASGSVPAGTPQAASPEPPSSNFPFTTGDEARYALEQQVAVDDVGKIAPRSGTLSFWLQPGWQEGNQDDASFLELGDGRLQVIKNVNFLRFEFTDDEGRKGGIGAPITDWKVGEWHQVATTWSGSTFSLYVDGQLVSQTTYPGGPIELPPDAKLLIGSAFPENRPVAPGVINGVDVSGRPLGPTEIAGLFAKSTGTRQN
jgi:hypothetical protein